MCTMCKLLSAILDQESRYKTMLWTTLWIYNELCCTWVFRTCIFVKKKSCKSMDLWATDPHKVTCWREGRPWDIRIFCVTFYNKSAKGVDMWSSPDCQSINLNEDIISNLHEHVTWRRWVQPLEYRIQDVWIITSTHWTYIHYSLAQKCHKLHKQRKFKQL